MNRKGEITFVTLCLVALLSSILSIAVYDVGRNCRLICKLDLSKYQEIQVALK